MAIDGDAAKIMFLELKPQILLDRQYFEASDGFADNLRADAVAGEDRDAGHAATCPQGTVARSLRTARALLTASI